MTDNQDQTPLVISATLDAAIAQKISKWCQRLDWPSDTVRKPWPRYHITLLYCPICSSARFTAEQNLAWAEQYAQRQFWVTTTKLAVYTATGKTRAAPVVLELDSPSLVRFADLLYQEATNRGLQPVRLSADGRFHGHIMLADAAAVPAHQPHGLSFQTTGIILWE